MSGRERKKEVSRGGSVNRQLHIRESQLTDEREGGIMRKINEQDETRY